MNDDAAHELVTSGQQAVDELSRTVSQCTDSISSAASELTHARSGKEAASAASELKQASRARTPVDSHQTHIHVCASPERHADAS